MQAGVPNRWVMEHPVDLTKATDMPILASIVVPLTAVHKEAIGEIRGVSRESCHGPLPNAPRRVQAERTAGGPGLGDRGVLGRVVGRRGRGELAGAPSRGAPLRRGANAARDSAGRR